MFEEEGKKYASNLELIYKKGVLDGYNKTKEETKTIIQDLLNNSDEYARQRAIDFLKESE